MKSQGRRRGAEERLEEEEEEEKKESFGTLQRGGEGFEGTKEQGEGRRKE